jgi:hypothetical protein
VPVSDVRDLLETVKNTISNLENFQKTQGKQQPGVPGNRSVARSRQATNHVRLPAPRIQY